MKYLKKKLSLSAILLLFFLFIALPGFTQGYNSKAFEKDIKEFDKRDSIEKINSGANLFVGSSSITNWKDIASYFPDANVINRGFGGSKFEDLLFFADRTIMVYKPAKIFIYEGDNDIASGMNIEVIIKQAQILREKIASELPGVPVVFISVKPSVARWHLKDKYEDFNRKLKKYAVKTKQTWFADVWTPMLDKNGEVYKHVFLEDNLHMTAKGYKIWQAVLKPFVVNKNDR